MSFFVYKIDTSAYIVSILYKRYLLLYNQRGRCIYMLRMEIALFFVLAFVACIYFSAGRKNTPLHKTFSVFIFFYVSGFCFATGVR